MRRRVLVDCGGWRPFGLAFLTLGPRLSSEDLKKLQDQVLPKPSRGPFRRATPSPRSASRSRHLAAGLVWANRSRPLSRRAGVILAYADPLLPDRFRRRGKAGSLGPSRRLGRVRDRHNQGGCSGLVGGRALGRGGRDADGLSCRGSAPRGPCGAGAAVAVLPERESSAGIEQTEKFRDLVVQI